MAKYYKYILLSVLAIVLHNSAFAAYTETVVSGTALENPATNWAANDDDSLLVNIGFDFPFGGLATVNQININSNGALSLSAWTAYDNTALSIATPSTVIAPFWDDINRSAGGTIRYGNFGSAPNRRFVVAWTNTPRYGTTASCTFQVVLYETGDIRFRYSTGNTQCDGSTATVGVQESSSVFTQHSFNAVINLSQDILYTPVSPPPPPPPPAPPLVIDSCDDFEYDLANWTISSSSGQTSITTATALSPTHSLSINGGVTSATSIPIDTSTNFKDLTIWIRRGSDAFSENPEGSENLIIEYFNSSSSWVALETFVGSGTAGQIFSRTYAMPLAAQHANFRIRLRMTAASGLLYDFWHVDDVCLVPITSYPNITMQKTSSVLSDGITASNPKRIPGAIIEYNITATNAGSGVADNNTVVISDAVPANTALYVNDISGAGTGPIRFVDGSPPSGLSYNFISLASTTDNLSFSNNGGTTYAYTPTPDAGGVDTNVTHIKMATTGSFLGDSGSGSPNFQFKFRVKVQ